MVTGRRPTLGSHADGRTVLLDFGEAPGQASPLADLVVVPRAQRRSFARVEGRRARAFRRALHDQGIDTAGWWSVRSASKCSAPCCSSAGRRLWAGRAPSWRGGETRMLTPGQPLPSEGRQAAHARRRAPGRPLEGHGVGTGSTGQRSEVLAGQCVPRGLLELGCHLRRDPPRLQPGQAGPVGAVVASTSEGATGRPARWSARACTSTAWIFVTGARRARAASRAKAAAALAAAAPRWPRASSSRDRSKLARS